MIHIKLFESYYKDLTTYQYGRPDECLNIGWIGKDESFETGDVTSDFIEKLEKVEAFDDYTCARHKGSHRCEICGERMGSSVKKIEFNKKGYKFPNSISHYVKDHNYKPPQEFIDAIMNIEVSKKDEFIGRRRLK